MFSLGLFMMATASTDQYAEKSKPSDPTIEEISQVKTNETGTTGDVAAAEKGENDHVAEQHVPVHLHQAYSSDGRLTWS